MPEVPILTSVPDVPEASSEAEEAALLARAMRSMTQRLVKLEAEQRALDENMQHIAAALEAIIEAAAASLEIKADTPSIPRISAAAARGKRSDADPR